MTLKPSLLLAAATLVAASPVFAAANNWVGTTGSWATGSNWSSTATPIGTDTITYTGTSTNLTQTLDGSYSIAGIAFTATPTGNETINAGTGTNTLTLGAGGINMANNGTRTLTFGPGYTLALGAAQTWTTSSNAITVNASLSGSANLILTGAGTVTLAADNSAYSGTINMGPGSNVGTTQFLVVGNANALGTGTLNSRGAQLQASVAGLTLTNAINVAGGGFRVGGTNAFTLSGLISLDNAQRTIGNYGATTITLSGGINLNSGTTSIASFDGGAINVTGVITGVGGVTVTNNLALNNTVTTLAGANTYTGTTTTLGTATLNLTGSLTSAVTIASGGTLTGTGSTTGLLTMNAGSSILLTSAGAITANGAVATSAVNLIDTTANTVGAHSYTVLTYGAGAAPTLANFTLNGAAISVRGPGLVNTGTATTLNYTTVANTWNAPSGTGVWDLSTTANWTNTSDSLFYNGDSVAFNDPVSAAIVTLNSTVAPSSITFNNTSAYTLSGIGAIAGASTLTKQGAGTVILATANTYTGGTTISAGTLQVGNAGTVGSLGSGAVANNAVLAFNRTDSTTIANAITGSGAVQVNSGTVAFSTQKTYTGGTTINSGATLDLTGGGGTGQGAIRGTVTVNSGATLRLSTGDATGYNTDTTRLGVINLVGGTLNVNTTANQTLGSAVINMTGASITGIAGSNIDLFANGSAINTFASSTDSVISLPSINLRQDNTIFTVAAGTAANDLLISSTIGNGSTGNHAMIKAGAGTMTLTGTNTYTGGTTINAGKIITGNTAALGTGAVTVNTGTLQIGNGTVHTVTLGSGASLVVASGATLKIDSATSAIALTGVGGFTLGSGAIIDLGGVFDGLGATTTYNLITGGSGTKTAGAQVTGYSTSVFSSVTFDNAGVLTFTAVPEPSTYGLLGAGALAAAALVRRRKRAPGIAA